MSGQFLKNDRKGAEGEIFCAFLFFASFCAEKLFRHCYVWRIALFSCLTVHRYTRGKNLSLINNYLN